MSALWVGSALSPYEQLCLSSFAAAGFTVRLFTFDMQMVVPDGVDRFDAREVLPQPEAPRDERYSSTYSYFSNIFRYRLLQEGPTTWIDTDVVLVADDLPAGDYLFGLESPGNFASGILRAPPGSPLVGWLNERARTIDPATATWGDIGPKLLTEGVSLLGLDDHAQPVSVLYPIHYADVVALFDPDARDWVDERLASASTLHLWNEVLRRGGPVKQCRPPSGSWLARAFDAHEIDFGTRDEHDIAWLQSVLVEPRWTVRRRLVRKARTITRSRHGRG